MVQGDEWLDVSSFEGIDQPVVEVNAFLVDLHMRQLPGQNRQAEQILRGESVCCSQRDRLTGC